MTQPLTPAEAVQRLTKTPPLRPKQEAFVQEIVKDGNGSRAARAAGYSQNAARQIASENLSKPAIHQAIQVVRQSVAERAGVDAVNLLKLAYQFATVDPAMLVDDEGAPIPLKQLPPEVRVAIQGLNIVPTPSGEMAYRYKLADKGQALGKLFRHLGMYEKDNTQSAGGGISALMQAIHAQGSRIPLKP